MAHIRTGTLRFAPRHRKLDLWLLLVRDTVSVPSSLHSVILLFRHPVIPSSLYSLIPSSCHPVIPCHPVIHIPSSPVISPLPSHQQITSSHLSLSKKLTQQIYSHLLFKKMFIQDPSPPASKRSPATAVPDLRIGREDRCVRAGGLR